MRVNKTITITPATPINIVTGKNAAQMAAAGMTSALAPAGSTFFVERTAARRIFMQMIHGGTGIGYVLTGSTGRAPVSTNSSDLASELAAASANAPGGSYSDADYGVDRSGIEIQDVWIDGAAADKVVISYDLV